MLNISILESRKRETCYSQEQANISFKWGAMLTVIGHVCQSRQMQTPAVTLKFSAAPLVPESKALHTKYFKTNGITLLLWKSIQHASFPNI